MNFSLLFENRKKYSTGRSNCQDLFSLFLFFICHFNVASARYPAKHVPYLLNGNMINPVIPSIISAKCRTIWKYKGAYALLLNENENMFFIMLLQLLLCCLKTERNIAHESNNVKKIIANSS
jgi:hypothetical protein